MDQFRAMEEKPRVLVTGGTGFLGGALITALVNSNRYSIRALVRRLDRISADFDPELLPEIELVQGDVLDLPSLTAACEGCHGVFHVAALVKSWSPDPSRFFQVNVDGLRNVISAVKSVGGVSKVVYTSSFFALGPTKPGEIGDEQQVHTGKDFCSEYEHSKFVADGVARAAAAEGFPIVLLYPGVVYGSGKLTRGNIIGDILIERFNWRLPCYIGFGHDRFCFSHVEDVAAGHIAAFEKGVSGEGYILGGENRSLEDVFNIAAKLTCTRRPWFHLPLKVVFVYGYLATLVSRLTGKDPVVTHPAVSVIERQWAYSIRKAEDKLGYKSRLLEEGLAEFLSYLKSQQLISY